MIDVTSGTPPQYQFTCPFCGGEIALLGSDMASELFDEYEGDDLALVYYMKCRKCGREYDVVEPMKEEREYEYRKFWL